MLILVDPQLDDPTHLLRRIAQGQPGAVEQCLEAYSGLVWSVARRYLGVGADAEDAVQEVFIELWRSAARFDPALGSEITFVSVLARRRCIDRLRRKRADPARSAAPLHPESAPAAPWEDDALELADEHRRAAEAFDTLRPEQQEVLRLNLQEGLSHQQIAEHLALPLGTVKTHARRGLLRLRALLGVPEGETAGSTEVVHPSRERALNPVPPRPRSDRRAGARGPSRLPPRSGDEAP